ncbi:MAG: 4-hydroxybenzoate polyprenyltransferase [Moorella sp. (in: firmicutes)]|jgi:4-hydroxybenzoate polyprenyltransferase|uniref:UbiA-like polyprenyltransferase n=1 Tax=Moorella sp. E308F TaxID=2572682 RepID=UPI0010FFB4BF|nr:UbiA-like polyprenyltransferase [Moorella sp. E308F]MDK2815779.1 4-hydroxybenzoate polyprenyltransferase [Moorella sp. (in: firmicutes)]MDK2895111.1 4-hydroxybenzoate polyprenyltransferase [Moorella sp. (in: firmicutes)]GEA16450.1 4-hydroxybenzoate octaprenyltransferase [Moorella sp. E308F]
MACRKLKIFLEMIKFEHTIFALPFAYLGAFLAAGGRPTPAQLGWITLAMIGARTAAMSLNRLIDRHIDALNPRTAGRALPRGLLSVAEVWLYTLLSFGLLFYAAMQLNWLCVQLLPIAVFVLVIYSYTKRWTWACHLVLGLADALAPVGAWVAVRATMDLPAIVLGLGMGSWVAGFDIIYACQDYDFDREYGIHSIPARFGKARALIIARCLHAFAILMLALVGVLLHLGLIYFLGVLLAAVILIYEHRLVSPEDLSRLNLAFLNLNGYLSVLMFVFTFLALTWR